MRNNVNRIQAGSRNRMVDRCCSSLAVVVRDWRAGLGKCVYVPHGETSAQGFCRSPSCTFLLLRYHATPLPVTSVTDNAETVRDWDSDGGRGHDGERCRRAVVAPRARRCRGLVRWALSSRGPAGRVKIRMRMVSSPVNQLLIPRRGRRWSGGSNYSQLRCATRCWCFIRYSGMWSVDGIYR